MLQLQSSEDSTFNFNNMCPFKMICRKLAMPFIILQKVTGFITPIIWNMKSVYTCLLIIHSIVKAQYNIQNAVHVHFQLKQQTPKVQFLISMTSMGCHNTWSSCDLARVQVCWVIGPSYSKCWIKVQQQDGGFYSQWTISHTPRYMFMWTYEYLQFLVIDVGQMNLAQYIREVALLTGTKVSCGEGGCGACIVTVNKEGKSRSVNSVRCFYRK